MGAGIHFKIQDVRNAATVIKADGDKFHTDISAKLGDLDLPWTAFPRAVPTLGTAYDHAKSGLTEVTDGLGNALVAIGSALDAVATFYEGVEQRHAQELAAI